MSAGRRAALALVSTAAPALADHGGGGAPPVPAAAAVTFTPASLTFAAQAIGTTSAAQPVAVANTGTAPLFSNRAAVPNTLDFTVAGDGCSGLTLAARTSCSMSITFSPTVAGTRTAALTVTDNAPGSPQTAR